MKPYGNSNGISYGILTEYPMEYHMECPIESIGVSYGIPWNIL
jgi:hypothetical protein